MRPFFLFITIISITFIVISCTNASYICYFKEDGLRSVTLNAIAQASHSLDICVYDISDAEIIELLNVKALEGVTVRICTDDSNSLFLTSSRVIYDTTGLMHNKYMIIDGKRLWFGSTNLTPTSLDEHENNVILTDDTNLIELFTNHFEQCFEGRFKTQRTPSDSPVVKFSPEENCFDMILKELSTAKRSVKIAMFAFSDNRIAHYLKILSSKGVNIKIIADREWNISSIYSDVEEMSRYTDMRFDGCQALLHEKFVIIDDRLLLTGSYNYTASAQSRNDEFLIKTSDIYLLERFISHFDRLWSESL